MGVDELRNKIVKLAQVYKIFTLDIDIASLGL